MSEATPAFVTTALSGYELLADPLLNKGTAFTESERDAFDLHGLLPPNVGTLDEQVSRRLQALRGFETDLERYAFLRELQDTNETLFYALLVAQSRRAAADRLHADRRRRLPAIQPPVPQAARAVSELAAQEAHRADPRASALRQGRGHRRDRRRAHPRPRRPGRRRHGHPDRQAGALHRLRRPASRDHAADPARCRHRQSATAWPIRSMSAGATSACAARNTTISSRPSSRRW